MTKMYTECTEGPNEKARERITNRFKDLVTRKQTWVHTQSVSILGVDSENKTHPSACDNTVNSSHLVLKEHHCIMSIFYQDSKVIPFSLGGVHEIPEPSSTV